MDEQSRPAEEPNLPRAHFHLTLALIFVPCGAVIAGWTLAIIDVLKGYSNRAQLTWTRLLVALVLVDALVLASAVWLSGRLEEIQKKAEARERRTLIGVAFETEDALKIREVPPGLPGAKAGLQTGDVIEKIDGTAVATPKALIEALQAKKAGTARTLTVKRGDAEREIAVTPDAPPVAGEKGLFHVEPALDRPVTGELFFGILPAMVLVALYAGWAKLKSPKRVPVWAGFLLALLGSMGGFVGFLLAVQALRGGTSLGHFLIAVLIQAVLLLGLTYAARRWLSPDVAPTSPATMPPVRAGFQGVFYLITGLSRIGILVICVAQWLLPDAPLGDPMAAQLSEAQFGVLGGILMVIGIAVVVPLAEETLFRGFLLPRLAAQWGEIPALITSSLLFAVLHLRDGVYMTIIFFYGWVFGWARLRSGSIWASTALHMTVNGVAAAAILLT